ncbi:MAG: hypothetical protein ACYC3O_04890 [Burkholderiales bacterium]
MNEHNLQLPFIIKPQLVIYVFILILGALVTLPVLSILQRGPSTYLPVSVILGVVWVILGILIFWISSQKIILLPEKLAYRQGFAKKDIYYQDITEIELKKIYTAGYRTSKQVRYMLEFHFQGAESFVIALKPFSLEDLSLMLSFLNTAIPNAAFNDLAQQMAVGTFHR